MKSITDIQNEIVDKGRLSSQTIKDLEWHLKNDADPHMAIILATDAKLTQLAPLIAKHLDNDDDFIRERTIGCLIGRLHLPEYAEKGLLMAKEDVDDVRNLALFSLGAVLDNVSSPTTRYEIATYLLHTFNNEQEDHILRSSAYFSILDALNIPFEDQPAVSKRLNFEKDINWKWVKKFEEKYLKN